jgi:hypothetical protein
MALALIMVGLRLAVFDYATFFGLRCIPNHDLYQGAAAFATSMHSMRWTGDIAWWNPAGENGYPQYYQALLSPLAPTLGHIVFILWAQLIQALARVDVVIPEYFQYLTVTYVVLPFLATLAFAWLCTILFRSRGVTALVVLVFTFSSTGLWNSAWVYFQEPASLYFLLGAVIGFLKRPSPRSASLVLAAGLVQLASVNYWTLFHSWFVLVVLGTYAIVHWRQVRRAGRRLGEMIRRWPFPATGLAVMILAVVGLWTGVVVSTLRAESAVYLREGRERFALGQAELPRLGFDLVHAFVPDFEAIAPRPHESPWTMHRAVYLGAFLLPALVAVSFPGWRRLDRWLLWSIGGIIVICLAPAPVRWAWETQPFMNQIRHLFRFYPALLRVLVVLLCGASLDRLLQRRAAMASRAGVLMGVVAVAIVLLGGPGFGTLSRLGGLPGGLLLVIPAVLVALAAVRPTVTTRRVLVAGLLLVASLDLLTYFPLVSRMDSDFTATRWKLGGPMRFTNRSCPLPEDVTSALRRPWEFPDPDRPSSLFENMPMACEVWPTNRYMPRRDVIWARRAHPEVRRVLWAPFLGFHAGRGLEWGNLPEPPALAPIPHEWQHRDYNSWAATIRAPEDGWLSIAQIDDPSWRATFDGQPIETVGVYVRTALPVAAGPHLVAMRYEPPARRLYGPASWSLEGTLLALVVVGWAGGGRSSARPRRR